MKLIYVRKGAKNESDNHLQVAEHISKLEILLRG